MCVCMYVCVYVCVVCDVHRMHGGSVYLACVWHRSRVRGRL